MNSSTEIFRTFIGIKPDEATMNFINDFQKQYKNASWAKNIRWTQPQNIHLTMRFFGDIDNSQIDFIQTALQTLLRDQPAFSVRINSPHPFPSIQKARMLAALIHKSEPLQQLAANIETIAVEAGLAPEERPFRGHLTIGRFRNPARHLEELLKETATTTMPIDHVIFYRSELKATGAEYSEIARFQLKSPQ